VRSSNYWKRCDVWVWLCPILSDGIFGVPELGKSSVVISLLLATTIAGLAYYNQIPMLTVQRILGVGFIHGTLEWLPVDPFGYFPLLVYSKLGFSGLSFETLVPYLKLGSMIVILLKLIEDSLAIISLLFARAWSRIWEMELISIEDIAKVLAGLAATFASSQLMMMSGFISLSHKNSYPSSRRVLSTNDDEWFYLLCATLSDGVLR